MYSVFRKEKKQLRDLCKEANYFNDSASPANLKQVEQIETLVEYLPIDDLKILNEKLKEENADQRSIILSEVKKMDEQMQQSRLELSQQSSSSSSATSTSNSTSKIKWTSDEIELLVKALRTYPAGVQNRWVVVQEYVKRCGGNPNRSVQDIMQKAKDVASGKKEVEESALSIDNIALNAHKQSTILENQAKLNQLTLSERDDVPTTAPWTVDEQRVFEQALRTYPATLGASRWDQIAECLPTRNKKECLERYKELARMVQAKKATK
jgi:DnaJ family protein C protein 2